MTRGTREEGEVVDAIEIQLTIMARNTELLRRRDVTSGELERAAYLILRAVERLGSTDINDLATALGLDPSTAGRQVAALAGERLVIRRSDAADRRRSVITVSDEGRRRLALTAERRRQRTEELVEGWPESERERFAALLSRYNAAVAQRYMTGLDALPARAGR